MKKQTKAGAAGNAAHRGRKRIDDMIGANVTHHTARDDRSHSGVQRAWRWPGLRPAGATLIPVSGDSGTQRVDHGYREGRLLLSRRSSAASSKRLSIASSRATKTDREPWTPARLITSIARSSSFWARRERILSRAGIAAAVDAFARSSQGTSLAELSPEKRDAVLTSIDANGAPNLKAFLTRARRLTMEGMFCDPHWGGIKHFAGWDLIRYPGVRLMVTADDQKMSAPAKPVHKGAYDSGENHGH